MLLAKQIDGETPELNGCPYYTEILYRPSFSVLGSQFSVRHSQTMTNGERRTENWERDRNTVFTINEIPVEDTFAEAFPMTAARVIVTAATAAWARHAAERATGYASSVIGCDAEAGIERQLSAEETPDGRPGISILFFSFNRDALQKAVVNRVGQCVLTCATTACYNGLPVSKEKSIRLGGNLRFFGDGWQISKLLDGRRYWRIPVMDGEFVCEDLFGTTKGVAGGNFLIIGETQAATLSAAEAAVATMRSVPGIILPFPGGIVRSGSKVGSKYKKLKASTNDRYCPTLRGSVDSALPDGAGCVYEIVIDGLNLGAVEKATVVGVRAACRPGVLAISAGNYGGKLGPFHLHLHQLLRDGATLQGSQESV
jgi:formylmethanofuran--tetrahydromethanopterin N-formyltransferase